MIGFLRTILADMHDVGLIAVDDLDTLAGLLYCSAAAPALNIARSADPVLARDAARLVLTRLIAGLAPTDSE
jgi:hypothetical protein